MRQLPVAYPTARISSRTPPGASPVRANRPMESVVVARLGLTTVTVAPRITYRVSPPTNRPAMDAETPAGHRSRDTANPGPHSKQKQQQKKKKNRNNSATPP